MSEFYKFAGEHPILTFLLMCLLMWTIVGVSRGLGRIGSKTTINHYHKSDDPRAK